MNDGFAVGVQMNLIENGRNRISPVRDRFGFDSGFVNFAHTQFVIAHQ